MKTRLWVAAPVLVIGAAIAGAMALGLDSPAASAAQAQVQGQDTSTLDDQTELALTVYNSDLALVRDVRNVQLPRGTFDLRFMDIAATVNPATVHFRSLTEPARVGRPRAELRVRPARTREAPAQVRRPRRHARAHACRTAAPRDRKRSRLVFSATTTRRSGRSATRSSPACMPITSASPSFPATSIRGRR